MLIFRSRKEKEVTIMENIMRLIPRTEGFLRLFPDLGVVDRFFDDFRLPQLFGGDGDYVPAFDITETDKEYTITGEIPGVEAKDLDVALSDGTLMIKGEKKREEEKKGEHFYRVEREYGSFRRGFCLPEDVKTEDLQAVYKDGILRITLPKGEMRTKRIEIKAEETPASTEKHVEVQ
jgi:HSP20 family protein